MSELSRLFDEFERTDSSPAMDTEPKFSAFNRLAWNNVEAIRKLLDEWFASYPAPHKRALRSRFRNDLDSSYQGAFFELAVHRLLVQLGHEVQVDPQIDQGLTPDFYASAKDKAFYVEATVVEPDTFQDSPREKQIFDELNKLRCPDFWLFAESIRGVLTSNPPLRKIRQEAQKWLYGLEWQTVGESYTRTNQYPVFELKLDDWMLRLSVMPRGEEARGKPVGRLLSGPWRSAMVDPSASLIQAIQSKARKYKRLNAPLVVAVNCLDRSGVDRTDELLALFGWEASADEPNAARISSPFVSERRDKIWDESKNTIVSAVLFFNVLQPNTLASALVCLYENPWASNPVPLWLRRLPHAIVTGELIRWHPGEPLHSIYNLPHDWPGPK